jgi:PrtD family type I secretion system ABC transporter
MAEELRHAIRRMTAMVAAFSFFMHLLVLVVPLYSLQIYDRVLSSQSGETLLWLTALAIFLIVVLAVIDALRARILVRVSLWLERRLAPVLIGRNLAGDLGRYGKLGTQGLDDLAALRRFMTGPGAINLFDAPWMPLYLAVIWLLSPWLGIVATLSAVCLILTGLANEVVTRRSLAQANAIGGETMAALRTTLLGAETVRALGMRPAVLQHWSARNDSVLSLQGQASDRAGMIQAFARFERLAAQIAIVGIGAWLVVGQAITPGALIAAAILVSRALAPAESLIGSWRSVAGAREAYHRILARLRDAEPQDGLLLPAPRGRLDIESVSLRLPGIDRPILDGIRFTLHAGESLGVIGPSGAGKSSLARLLLGVVPPSAGSIRIDGADIAGWNRDLLGRYCGYVPQEIRLFPGTVADNIARLGGRDDALVVDAARSAGAHEMILRLPQGYDTDIDPGSPALSGGQRQLIALARAFYGGPRLLVLDEPNSNLDRDGEAALLAALDRAKAAGITTVVIAHRPSIVAGLDRLLVLRDGRLGMYGPRSEVLARTTGVVPFKRPAIGANAQAVPS